MENYIIDILHAINSLCNMRIILFFIVTGSLYISGRSLNTNTTAGLLFYIISTIALLGVMFIPSKESLTIILLN